jgi:electron transport complex protein RnfA
VISELWFILISTVLVNNLVLTQFLGMDPAMTASRSLRPTLLLCAATSAVLLVVGFALGLARPWLPSDASGQTFLLVVSVLIIGLTCEGVDRIARDIAPLHYRALGHHFPLLFCNSAILGVTLTLGGSEESIVAHIARVVATALAFTLVMIVMAGARERLVGADVPAAFRGIAISLMTLGLLSLAFAGFTGMAGV